MRGAEIVEMLQESRGLALKLEELEKQKQRQMKQKEAPRVTPLQPKTFRKAKPEFEMVASQVSSDMANERRVEKARKLAEAELERQAASCTFRPQVNELSKSLAQRANHLPIHERPLPKPEPRSPSPQETQPLSASTPQPHVPEIDPEYYKKQLDWMNSIEERKTRERLERAIGEFTRKDMIPKVNRKKNEKLVQKQGDFLTRVEQDAEALRFKKEKLDKIYNGHQFRPRLNRNFQEVAPLYNAKPQKA